MCLKDFKVYPGNKILRAQQKVGNGEEKPLRKASLRRIKLRRTTLRKAKNKVFADNIMKSITKETTIDRGQSTE